MEDERKPQGSFEEAEAEEERPDEEPGTTEALAQASEQAEKALEPLQKGPAVSLGFADFPVRILAAVGIFIAVFMAVWMILWAVGGGAGLGLGWLLAAAAGALAVKVYADSARSADPE